MSNADVVIGVIVGVTVVMGTFFKLVFDYAILRSTTSQILKEVLEIKKYLTEHDRRLDSHENRITIIETNCKNHHREEKP